jgi:hypothetical protein
LRREPGALRLPSSRAGNGDQVTAALQAYADRGVFRGFRATPLARGQIEYQFLWLTKRPMRAVFNSTTKRLTFPSVLPQIDSIAAAEMKAAIASRSDRDQPEHKRIDARRSRISGAIRKGDFSLTVDVRGKNHDYAVSKALNVINEMFVILHEHHPGYLVERFGISTE